MFCCQRVNLSLWEETVLESGCFSIKFSVALTEGRSWNRSCTGNDGSTLQ